MEYHDLCGRKVRTAPAGVQALPVGWHRTEIPLVLGIACLGNVIEGQIVHEALEAVGEMVAVARERRSWVLNQQLVHLKDAQ